MSASPTARQVLQFLDREKNIFLLCRSLIDFVYVMSYSTSGILYDLTFSTSLQPIQLIPKHPVAQWAQTKARRPRRPDADRSRTDQTVHGGMLKMHVIMCFYMVSGNGTYFALLAPFACLLQI